MRDYSKGLIYKICCLDPKIKDVYVGSTTKLVKRRCQHKNACNNENCKNHNLSVYQFIRANGGWENWEVVQIEKYSCETKAELETRERYHLETLGATLNCKVPTRTKKEYYKDNFEAISERHKQYNLKNPEYQKQYRQDNREVLLEKRSKKINCECGTVVCKNYILRHRRTQKHIAWVLLNK